MLERVVEHWLTRAGERSYEIAFAQLLLAEGWRILHGPVHHPYEHGKDIAAMDPDGRLCGIQLKDGDVSLADFEKYQSQLIALSRTAITYPGIEPPRLPDRVLFVTNGVLTPPVVCATGGEHLEAVVLRRIDTGRIGACNASALFIV